MDLKWGDYWFCINFFHVVYSAYSAIKFSMQSDIFSPEKSLLDKSKEESLFERFSMGKVYREMRFS